jgi:hypothetical protein
MARVKVPVPHAGQFGEGQFGQFGDSHRTEPRDRNILRLDACSPLLPWTQGRTQSPPNRCRRRKKTAQTKPISPLFSTSLGKSELLGPLEGPEKRVQSSRSIRFPRGFRSGELASTARDRREPKPRQRGKLYRGDWSKRAKRTQSSPVFSTIGSERGPELKGREPFSGQVRPAWTFLACAAAVDPG